jgi:hypothetical protein
MPRKRITPITAGPPGAKFDFESSFQRFTDPETFVEFCQLYPKPEGVITYLYRLQPVIDREQIGSKDTSIDKVTGEVVDTEWLGRKWGSGRYLCLFNDSSRPANLQQVAKCVIDVEDPTLAPVLDPAELVINEKNAAVIAKYLNLGWTIVDKTNELKPNGFRQLVAPVASGNAEKVLAETVQSLALNRPQTLPSNAVVVDRDMLRELLSGARKGGDDLERAFAIAERLRAPEDKTTQVLLSKMADALLVRGQNPAAPPAADGVAQLRATMQFLRDEMGWSAANGGSARTGAGIFDAIAALPGILQHGSAFLSQMIALRMMQPAGTPAAASLPAGR